MRRYFSDNIYKIYVEAYGDSGKNLVLIPGAYHTGICFTDKPDGKEGWVKFLMNSYKVFVTDIPGTGRSGYVDFSKISGEFIIAAYKNFISSLSGDTVLLTHSLSGPWGFKLAELFPKKLLM